MIWHPILRHVIKKHACKFYTKTTKEVPEAWQKNKNWYAETQLAVMLFVTKLIIMHSCWTKKRTEPRIWCDTDAPDMNARRRSKSRA